MQMYNTYRLYVKKYNLSVQFLLTSAKPGMFRAIQEQISRLMKEEDAVTVTTELMYLETLIKNKASD